MTSISPRAELEGLLTSAGLEFDEIKERVDGDTTSLDIISSDHAQMYGRRGQTFEAIQYLLRSILWKKGYHGYINLDLNSTKENQYEQIRGQAREAAQKVKDGDDRADLPFMNPALRRVAHMTVRDEFPDLVTESIEDRGWKFVRILPKSE